MIGHKMWQALNGLGHDVSGTVHGRRDVFAAYDLFDKRVIENFEAEAPDAVTRLLDELQPAVIVNCLGITKRKLEANDVRKMFAVNALFPHHLARWAGRNSARVIQFSTDCVFDGSDGGYTERSVLTADDLYGQSKYFGELDYDHCLTIRTSMIGRELAGKTELLEWFLAQRGKTVSGFKGSRYSGLTTLEMGTIIRKIIEELPGLSGRYQIAGPVITKYDLLCLLRDSFGMDVQIMPDEKFQCDRTLQSDRFFQATRIRVSSWQDMIAGLVRERALYDRSVINN